MLRGPRENQPQNFFVYCPGIELESSRVQNKCDTQLYARTYADVFGTLYSGLSRRVRPIASCSTCLLVDGVDCRLKYAKHSA